jgi:hypothetical protein
LLVAVETGFFANLIEDKLVDSTPILAFGLFGLFIAFNFLELGCVYTYFVGVV